ncbi:MAG TPA: apolipoprotein N-acyltransferase [Deltaproteobacteria bacterium]|nr:apolipoprotein N-acyltransferase [Deltaproteobacteria bacterium]
MAPPPSIWLRILAATVGASTLSLLAPPANWHALHWIAYLPMFWALHPETPRANRWLSVLYGTLGVALLFRWIVHTITVFSPSIPFVGAVGILLLFGLVFGLPYLLLWPSVHPLRRRVGISWVFLLPALQVVIEWLSAWLLLFPYNHGVSQYRFPYTWQLASVTGVWGLTYLVFLSNTALAEVLYRHREGRAIPWATVSSVVAILSGVVLFGAWRYERVEAALRDAPTLRVAQLQSDKGMEYRMSHSRQEGFEDWLRQTQSVPAGTDLAVWAEGACPFDLNESPGVSEIPRLLLSETAKAKDMELIIGAGTRIRRLDEATGEQVMYNFNSVYHFNSDGQVDGRYDKMVPLPFGEYLPLGGYLPGLSRALGIGSFEAGDVPIVFDGEHARIASPICYEAILPSVCRMFTDAELFVTVTNDAWFGDTASPHQHAMLAAVRATELGVPVFRSAYTGVSMVIEPHGAIHYETRPFTEVARVVEVRLGHRRTFYAIWGDWFVVLCALSLSVVARQPRPRAHP